MDVPLCEVPITLTFTASCIVCSSPAGPGSISGPGCHRKSQSVGKPEAEAGMVPLAASGVAEVVALRVDGHRMRPKQKAESSNGGSISNPEHKAASTAC